MRSDFLPQLTWRTGAAAVLAFAAVLVWAWRSQPPDVPAEHVNGEAGFGIRPPPGWSLRLDDADGSRIRPPSQPEGGAARLIVSSRLARDPSPLGVLHEIAARPATGPIRELRWIRQERITLDGGADAALGEFLQVEHGVALHSWMVVTVRDSQMLQAVIVVPERAKEAWEGAMLASLRSLRSI